MKTKQSVLLRIVAVILTAMLLIGTVPAAAFAETLPDTDGPSATDETYGEDPTGDPDDGSSDGVYGDPDTDPDTDPDPDADPDADADPDTDPTEDPTAAVEDGGALPGLTGGTRALTNEVILYDDSDNKIVGSLIRSETVKKIELKILRSHSNLSGLEINSEDDLAVIFAVGWLPQNYYTAVDASGALRQVSWNHNENIDNSYVSYSMDENYYIITLDVEGYRDKYNAPDIVDGKLVAYASVENPDNGKETVLLKKTHTVDGTAPTVKFSPGNTDTPVFPDGWTREDVGISFTAEDANGIADVWYVKNSEYQSTLSPDIDGYYNYSFTEYTYADTFALFVKDTAGNQWSWYLGQDVKIDKTAPTIQLVKYSNYDESNNQTWVGTSTTVSVTLKVTDAGSGVDLNGFKIGGSAVSATKNGDEYTIVLSDKDHVNAAAVTITATDNAGNTKTFTTEPLLIDRTVPSPDDINVNISGVETNALLSILSFGLYHNDDLKLTVSVSPAGGAPITKIELYDGTSPITASSDITVDSGRYVREFTVNAKDTELKLNLVVGDAAGNTRWGTSILDVANLSSDEVNLKDKINEGVYQVVATKLAPGCEFTVTGDKSVQNGDNTVFNGGANVDVTVSDQLSGLTGDVTYYFNAASKFTDNGDGTFTVPASVKPLTITPTFTNGTGAFAEKKISCAASYSIPDTTASGDYLFLVKASNNSGNTGWYAYHVYIDNSAPVLSGLTYDDSWSKDPIPVTFTVKDEPAIGAGIKSVTVTDGDGNVLPAESVTANGDGSYTFNAEKNTEFTITAADNFDQQAEAEIKAKITKLDTGMPTATITEYSNKTGGATQQKWSKTPVTVKFTVADPAAAEGGTAVSGIDRVYVTNSAGDAVSQKDLGSNNYSITVDACDVYTIHVIDKAGNESAIQTENVLYDNNKPVFVKAVFRDSTTDDIRTFGLYKKQTVMVDIYVQSVGGAPITKIDLTNNNVSLYTDGAVTDGITQVAGDPSMYKKTFPIPESTTAYKLAMFAETAAEVSDSASSFAGIGVYADDQVVAINPELFEVVITTATPVIGDFAISSMTSAADAGTSGQTVYTGSTGTLTFKLTDTLAGIDKDSIVIQLDGADVGDGFTCDFDTTKKVTELTVSYPFDVDFATGVHEFDVSVANLAGNNSTESFDFYIDNSAPVISNVTYNGSALMTEWTNEQIKVAFRVNDSFDEMPYSGVDAASFIVRGGTIDALYAVSLDAESGRYYFMADLHQDYDVTVADAFGNRCASFTISKDDVLYDDEEPNLGGILYQSGTADPTDNPDDVAVTAEGVKITFTVDDKSAVGAHEWLSGRIDGNPAFTIVIKAVNANGEELSDEIALDPAEPTYSSETDKYTYGFVSKANYSYNIYVTDTAGNTAMISTLKTTYDETAPVITGFKAEQKAGDVILSILTFGIYSNDEIILTVYAFDADPSAGIDDITAAYDGTELTAVENSYASSEVTGGYSASKSFVIPIAQSKYDPEKLVATVTDNVGKTGTNVLSSADVTNENDPVVGKPFEIVSTQEPAVINDFTVDYQLGYVDNAGEDNANVYSANINKAENGDTSADGSYSVTIEDALSGIDASSIKAYFDVADKFTEGTNGFVPNDDATEVTDALTVTPTTDNETLKGKILAEDISYDTPADLATGRYVFYVEAKNNSGNTISKSVDVYVDNTDPGFVGGFTYSNENSEHVQQWSGTPVTVSFTVTDDPDAYGYYGGVAAVSVVGANGVEYQLNEDAISATEGTYSFDADLYQTYTVTVTDVFGRTTTATTDPVLYDGESPKVTNFTYDGETYAGDAEWKNETDGMTVTFDVEDKSDVDAIKGTWLSGKDGDASAMTVTVTGNDNNKDYSGGLTYTYDADKDVFTYSFKADFYQTYKVIVTDPVDNEGSADSGTTKVDVTDPYVIEYGVRVEETNKILNILTFGIYSNDAIILSVTAKDPEAACGIADITATYDGDELAVKDALSVSDGDRSGIDASESTATKSFIIPVSDISAYDPEKLDINVVDRVGNDASRNIDELNSDENVQKYDQTVDHPFEVVATHEPVTVNDIVLEYQLGYVENAGAEKVNVYSANIDKAANGDTSADGSYSVMLEDALAGIDAATIHVYFDSIDKFNEDAGVFTLNGATEVTADAVITPTMDETLIGKIIAEDIAYETPADLATGRYVFYVEATNNSGNVISKAVDIYLDNTDPAFVGGFTYSNENSEHVQQWSGTPVNVTFTVTDDPDAYDYYGGVADITVVGANGTEYFLNENDISLTEDTYSFFANLNQTYTVTVTDVFGRTVTATTDPVLYDGEAAKITNFTYDGKDNAAKADWKNEADGMTVAFDVEDKSEVEAIKGTWLSGKDADNNSTLTVKVIGNTNNKDYSDGLTYIYDAEKDVFTYSFKADFYQTYKVEVTDPVENYAFSNSNFTKVDVTAPYVIEYGVRTEEQNKILNILTFGIYSNSAIVLTVVAEDPEAACGVKSITATYDGVALAAKGSISISDNERTGLQAYTSTARKSFIIPINDISAYDPEKLDITVADYVGNDTSRNVDQLNADDAVQKYDETVEHPFEVVATKEPVTINDITFAYQLGYVVNAGTEKVNVYSANINKAANSDTSADGSYSVKLEDALAGIDAATVQVYFDSVDMFTTGEYGFEPIEGAAEVTADAVITPTMDETLTGKVLAEDISYDTPADLATGRYVFYVVATNNSGNVISKAVDIYLDNTDPVFVGGFTYSNAQDGVQKWTNKKVDVTFTVTDDPDAYDYYGGVADITVVGDANGETYPLNEGEITLTEGTYSFTADLYQTYTVTVTDVFGRTAVSTTDLVLYDNEPAKITNFTYDGKTDAAEAAWKNKADGMTVTFDVEDRSDVTAIKGTWLSGMEKEDNVDTNVSALTVKVTGNANGKDYPVTYVYDADKNVFTYSFTSDFYQTYKVEILDPAGNRSGDESDYTKVDVDAPYVTGFSVKTEELNKILNILTFGIYSNSAIILTVDAEDAEAACGIEDIIATYDGTELEVKDALAVSDPARTGLDASTSTATKSFIIPINDISAYDPEKLDIRVVDRVGNDSSRNVDELNGDDNIDKYDQTVEHPFEVVATKEPVTINDITFAYQLGYVVNAGTEKVNVYSANINKAANSDTSADGSYSVKLEDALAGIDAATVQVYFDSVDMFTTGEYGFEPIEGAAEVTADAVITPTMDETLTGKIIAEDISYETPADLATGRYVFYVVATNNSGNVISKAVDVYLDNTDPAFVGGFTYSNAEDGVQKWTNEKVDVTFTVTDDPDAYDYYGGVADITVVGDANGETYPLNEGEITLTEGTYSFTADLYQTYTVTVTDVFGRTAVSTTDLVLYDDEMHSEEHNHFSAFRYNGEEDINDIDWFNESDGITVSFDVDDRSDVDAIKDTWLSGMEKEDNVDTSVSALTVKVTGNTNGKDYPVTYVFDSTKNAFTYSFKADYYQTYTVEISDPAGNVFKTETTTEVKVDTTAPVISKINFTTESSAADKLLNFLTFGLYCREQIIMTVEITDSNASSGIDSGKDGDVDKNGIHAYYEDEEGNKHAFKPYNDVQNGTADPAGVVATRSFIIEDHMVIDASKITIDAVDHVGYETGVSTLAELNKADKVETNGISKFDDVFEVVASSEEAEFSEINYQEKSYGDPEKDTKYYTVEGKDGKPIYYFSGHIIVSFTVTAPESKLHYVKVKLNNNDITPYCTDDQGHTVIGEYPTEYSHYGNDESGEKIAQVNISFDTSTPEIAGILRRMSKYNQENNANVIELSGQSNNGVNIPKAKEKFFIIDDAAPSITGFKFGKDGELFTPAEADDHVVKTSYGYYFRETTDVYVSAADVDLAGVDGSGVNRIHFYGDSIDQLGSQSIADTFVSYDDFEEIGGVLYAKFTVNAGFKGTIFAYAFDNVENRGSTVAPDGVIVESAEQHAAASHAMITVDTSNQVGTDHEGHPLFNSAATVSFEVGDTFSGIDRIVYTLTDYDGNATDHPTTVGYNCDNMDGEEWTVSERDNNLATRLNKTIVVSPSEYNCNNIKINLKAYDKAGFEITAEEKIISIDTTPPEITVEYDPAEPVNAYSDGMNYFNTNRTATITVKERNFNPSDFSIASIIAINGDGTVPASVNPGDGWSGYTDYRDTTTHTATVTFDTDGKYWVQLDYTDMAKNAAAHYGPTTQESNVKDIFCIDKTAPVVELSLSSDAAARHDIYYSDTVVATITVTEHNFDPNYECTFNPDFKGPDNVESITGPSIDWSAAADGDTHRGTITFTREEYDGKFSYTFKYKDLANNESEEKTQETFYVDSKTSDPAIEGVEDQTPYEREDVAPTVVIEDPNFDSSNYTIIVTRYRYNTETQQVEYDVYSNTGEGMSIDLLGSAVVQTNANGETGVIFSFYNLPARDEFDGVYVIESFYTDMAGNESKHQMLSFSLNRFGAIFFPGDDATRTLLDDYYTNDPSNIVIKEINVNKLTSYELSLTYNSGSVTLSEGADFTISEEHSTNGWYMYTYTIKSDKFAKEGEYTVTITSVDEFNNTISNRTALDTFDDDGNSITKRSCPVSFEVDMTPPDIQISGVVDGLDYSEDSRTIYIVCTDDNLDKESLVVTLNDKEYTIEDLRTEFSADIDETLVGELDVTFTLDAGGQESINTLKVKIDDLAKNTGEAEAVRFTLSATFWTLFFHSPLALILTGVGLVALIGLIIFIVLKKKKKNKAGA